MPETILKSSFNQTSIILQCIVSSLRKCHYFISTKSRNYDLKLYLLENISSLSTLSLSITFSVSLFFPRSLSLSLFCLFSLPQSFFFFLFSLFRPLLINSPLCPLLSLSLSLSLFLSLFHSLLICILLHPRLSLSLFISFLLSLFLSRRTLTFKTGTV